MGNSPIRLHGFRKMVLLLVPPIPGEAKKRREKKNPTIPDYAVYVIITYLLGKPGLGKTPLV